MTTGAYIVETYAGDGCDADRDEARFDTLEEALDEVSSRLGRPVAMPPDWYPDEDVYPDGDLSLEGHYRPLGAWHESERELCGGVAVWKTKS